MLLSKEGISYLYFWPIPDRSIHHVINFASFRRSPAPPRLFVHVAACSKHSEETKVQQVRTPVSELLSASDRDGKPCPRIPRAQGFLLPAKHAPCCTSSLLPYLLRFHRAAGNKGRESAIQIRAKTRDIFGIKAALNWGHGRIARTIHFLYFLRTKPKAEAPKETR